MTPCKLHCYHNWIEWNWVGMCLIPSFGISDAEYHKNLTAHSYIFHFPQFLYGPGQIPIRTKFPWFTIFQNLCCFYMVITNTKNLFYRTLILLLQLVIRHSIYQEDYERHYGQNNVSPEQVYPDSIIKLTTPDAVCPRSPHEWGYLLQDWTLLQSCCLLAPSRNLTVTYDKSYAI